MNFCKINSLLSNMIYKLKFVTHNQNITLYTYDDDHIYTFDSANCKAVNELVDTALTSLNRIFGSDENLLKRVYYNLMIKTDGKYVYQKRVLSSDNLSHEYTFDDFNSNTLVKDGILYVSYELYRDSLLSFDDVFELRPS